MENKLFFSSLIQGIISGTLLILYGASLFILIFFLSSVLGFLVSLVIEKDILKRPVSTGKTTPYAATKS